MKQSKCSFLEEVGFQLSQEEKRIDYGEAV